MLVTKSHHAGKPCDVNGLPLDPGTQPSPRTSASDDDWFPYENKTQFLLADFLYRKAQMSAGNVNELMEIWDDFMSPYESFAPYQSATHLLDTIDATTLGDAPWHVLNVSFSGEAGVGSPSWMSDVYSVWYREPLVVARNILDNPDFASEIDYAPYVELGKDGKRRWSDFMSGNLAWRHSVFISFVQPYSFESLLVNPFHRTSSIAMIRLVKAQCTVLSCLAVTRRLSLSLQANSSIGRCTFQSVIFTTMFAELTEMVLYR